MNNPFAQEGWRSLMNSAVSPAIDAAFGEPLTVVPTTIRPNHAAQPDYNRAVTVTGVFGWRAHAEFAHKPTDPMIDPLPVMSRKPAASFGRDNLPFPLKQGYWIKREADGNLFEVKEIRPDGVSRIDLTLLQMGVPNQ